MTAAASSQSGFSLVEVLVALFILALASTAIVMAFPKRESRLDRETARLEVTIERIVDDAIASGETRGLRLTKTGYAVETWRRGQWVASRDAPHSFPAAFRLSVQETGADKPAGWPDIIADATGMAMAPAVTLQDGSEVRTLTVTPSGAVQVGH